MSKTLRYEIRICSYCGKGSENYLRHHSIDFKTCRDCEIKNDTLETTADMTQSEVERQAVIDNYVGEKEREYTLAALTCGDGYYQLTEDILSAINDENKAFQDWNKRVASLLDITYQGTISIPSILIFKNNILIDRVNFYQHEIERITDNQN